MTPRALDPATVRSKLRALEELVDALAIIGEVSGDRLRREVLTRLAIERVLTQTVDLTVSVCSHAVGADGARTPVTYREAIDAAAAIGVIDAALAGSLGPAVGLRNLLVHEYARVDMDLVAEAVPVAARDVGAFVQQVAAWLARRS